MEVLLWVFLAFLFMVVVAMTTAFLVVRAIIRRLRRSRAVGGAVLRTRARLSHGARGRVRRLRVRLHDTLDSGRSAIELADGGDGPRGELSRLFRRIRQEGEALDRQLRLMESETDAAVLAEDLPGAADRVEQVAALVRRLRSAVASGLGDLSDDSLTTLRSDVDREVAALHTGVEALRALNRRDALFEPAAAGRSPRPLERRGPRS
ncbi:hypothetical protein [Agromyces sp. NPDC049794]|uniref:hypothetical protein n=1 Tax=unclassified Agromyces TaxID=2639701 RepID=UPI0033E4243D